MRKNTTPQCSKINVLNTFQTLSSSCGQSPLESQTLAFLSPLPRAHHNLPINWHHSWKNAGLEEVFYPIHWLCSFPSSAWWTLGSHSYQHGARSIIPRALTLPGKPRRHQDPGVGVDMREIQRKAGRHERRDSICSSKINPYELKSNWWGK